jgi:hypothetical protein
MLAPLVVLVTLDRSPIGPRPRSLETGRTVKDAVQDQIQLGEERWLGTLAPGDRATFLRVLEHLVDEPD